MGLQVFNHSKLLSIFSVDEAKEIIDGFLDTAKTNIDEMDLHISKGEYGLASRAVHSLQGMAGMCCIEVIHGIGFTLETQLLDKDISNVVPLKEAFKEFEKHIASLDWNNLK
jgi:HPt (histidine-containing phosphotransfer) domain-containing protein